VCVCVCVCVSGKTNSLKSLFHTYVHESSYKLFWINLSTLIFSNLFLCIARAQKNTTIKGENMTTMITTMTAATTTTRARCFLKKSGINGNDRRNATTKTTTATLFASLRNTNNNNTNNNNNEDGKIGKEVRDDDDASTTTTSNRRQFALFSATALASVVLALGQPMDAEALSLKSSNKNGVYWIEPKVSSVFSSSSSSSSFPKTNKTHEQTQLSSSSS
jgi:hypothetical protein